MDELAKKALEQICDMAYDKALFKETCDTCVLWDIYWLCRAALDGKKKANLLSLAEQLSGESTGGPNREIEGG